MTTNTKAVVPSKKTTEKKEKRKRKFKMPSAIAIIVGVVVFIAILTWIPHGPIEGVGGSLHEWQVYLLSQDVASSGIIISLEPDTFGQIIGVENASLTFEQISEIINNSINTLGLSGSIVQTDSFIGQGSQTTYTFVTHTDLPFTLSSFEDGTTSRFGLLDTVKAMLGGYQSAFGVAVYLIGIYAVVELLMRTDTLKTAVSSLVKGLNGHEIILLPLLFLLFSLGGTLFGMQEETLGLIPIIVPVIILAGFDAPIGMMVIVLGTTTGIAASVLDPFSVGVMAAGLGTGIGTGIVQRMILFVIYTSIGMSFVTWYGRRVLKDNKKSLEVSEIEANKKWAEDHIGDIHQLETMNTKQKAALWIFAGVFAWMVFALMPWVTWFPSLETSEIWISFSSIFFAQVLLGEWYFIELAILFALAAILIAKIFRYSTSEIGNVFLSSFKAMFGVITIIAFSRATSIIMSTSGLTFGMIYGMADPETFAAMPTILFTTIWFFIFMLMAVFIPSTSGLAGITAPIIGGVISGIESLDPAKAKLMIVGILMVYPLAQGVINMFSPTTGLVVVQAQQSRVSFGKVMPWLAGYAAVIATVGLLSSSLLMWINMSLQ